MRVISIDINRRKRRDGFSLLEMLVALAIAALCVVMLSGIFYRMNVASKSLQSHVKQEAQRDALTGILKSLLSSVPIEETDAKESNVVGSSTNIRVRSVGPPILGLDAETEFTIRYDRSPDVPTGAIILAWVDPNSSKTLSEVVVANVTEFSLSYRSRLDRAGAWSPVWLRSASELGLVKVVIGFNDQVASERAVNLLLVSTRLSQKCVVEPLLGLCSSW